MYRIFSGIDVLLYLLFYQVLWAEQQHLLDRRRKDNIPTFFNDPRFPEQWYLVSNDESLDHFNVETFS